MSLGNQAGYDFHSTGPGENRVTRLKLAHFQLHLIFFGFPDIGWVGDHEVQIEEVQSFQQIRLMELDALLELMAGSVGASDFERSSRYISRVNFGAGKLFGQGQRDATGAGTNIYNPDLGPRASDFGRGTRGCYRGLKSEVRRPQFEYCFDHVLGLWAWNEHRWGDNKVHAPEFLVSGDVLRWHSPPSIGERGIVARLFLGCKFALGMREEIGAITIQREHEEQFGVQTWGWDVVRSEAGDGRGEGFF